MKENILQKFNEKYLLIVLFASFLILAGFSYFIFQNYNVNLPTISEDIKGAKDNWSFDFPIPKDSVRIASNRTSETQQITIQSNKNPEQIHTFYKNVFLDQNYVLESESVDDGFTIKKYYSDDKSATVIAYKEIGEGYSIASVELSVN